MKRRLVGLISLLVFLVLISQFRLVRVKDDDMFPGFQAGDLVLLGPGRAQLGDVVRLHDPNQSNRQIFRRVVAQENDLVRYKNGSLSVNGEGLRVREMHQDGGWALLSEANAWLIRKRAQRDYSREVAGHVPEGSVYLLADARDESIDSRWWGAIKRSQIGKKIWMRWGPSDTWRDSFSRNGRDGPWNVPPPETPGPGAIPSTPNR